MSKLINMEIQITYKFRSKATLIGSVFKSFVKLVISKRGMDAFQSGVIYAPRPKDRSIDRSFNSINTIKIVQCFQYSWIECIMLFVVNFLIDLSVWLHIHICYLSFSNIVKSYIVCNLLLLLLLRCCYYCYFSGNALKFIPHFSHLMMISCHYGFCCCRWFFSYVSFSCCCCYCCRWCWYWCCYGIVVSICMSKFQAKLENYFPSYKLQHGQHVFQHVQSRRFSRLSNFTASIYPYLPYTRNHSLILYFVLFSSHKWSNNRQQHPMTCTHEDDKMIHWKHKQKYKKLKWVREMWQRHVWKDRKNK